MVMKHSEGTEGADGGLAKRYSEGTEGSDGGVVMRDVSFKRVRKEDEQWVHDLREKKSLKDPFQLQYFFPTHTASEILL